MTLKRKELVLALVLVFAAALFWLSLNQFLPHLGWAPTPLLVSAFFSTFLLMVVWGLVSLLIETSFTAVASWAAVSYMGLWWIASPLFIAVSTVFFLFGVIGYFRTRREMHSTVEGGIVRPLRKVIPLTATALVAVVAVGAYARSPTRLLDVSNIVPEKFFVFVLEQLEPAIQKSYDPSFSSPKTVGEYAVGQLEKEGQKISPAQHTEAARVGAKLMSEKLGISIKADETLGHVLYRVGTAFIARQAEAYKSIFPIAYALGLFATLRFIALFLNWIVIFFVFLALKFLTVLGIIDLRSIPTVIIEYSFR